MEKTPFDMFSLGWQDAQEFGDEATAILLSSRMKGHEGIGGRWKDYVDGWNRWVAEEAYSEWCQTQ